MIQIHCLNTQTTKEFQEGVTLLEILPEFRFEQPFPIVSAKVNNVSQGLKFRVYNSRDVEFLDLRHSCAMRVYCRSLCFLLYKAAIDLFPGSRLYMEHPISNGFFCHIKKADRQMLNDDEIEALRQRMRAIVNDDLAFHRHEARIDEAIAMFDALHQDDKVKLMETSGQVYTDYYTLGDTTDYYYSRLVPDISLNALLCSASLNDTILGLIFLKFLMPICLHSLTNEPLTYIL